MYLYKYIYINILPIIYQVIVYQNFGLLFRSNNNIVQQFYFQRKFVSLPQYQYLHMYHYRHQFFL